jgi:protein-disulfide isomerase
MRTTLTALTLALAAFTAPYGVNAEEAAPIEQAKAPIAHPLAVLPYDISVGKEDAPLTVIEYASLTCSHCAHFHKDTYDEVKKNYIDTGKVRFIFRHMPWDNMAMAASKLAVCAKSSGAAFISAFMKTQESWAHVADPLAELKKVAKLGGMDNATADACLQNAEVHQQVLDIQATGRDILGVKSTPTFFVGSNVVVEGFRNYESFSKTLDAALAHQAQAAGK